MLARAVTAASPRGLPYTRPPPLARTQASYGETTLEPQTSATAKRDLLSTELRPDPERRFGEFFSGARRNPLTSAAADGRHAIMGRRD
jgi:hypothetical protein